MALSWGLRLEGWWPILPQFPGNQVALLRSISDSFRRKVLCVYFHLLLFPYIFYLYFTYVLSLLSGILRRYSPLNAQRSQHWQHSPSFMTRHISSYAYMHPGFCGHLQVTAAVPALAASGEYSLHFSKDCRGPSGAIRKMPLVRLVA